MEISTGLKLSGVLYQRNIIVILQFLQVSDLLDICSIFYEQPKLKNWMFNYPCFSKSGHIYSYVIGYSKTDQDVAFDIVYI